MRIVGIMPVYNDEDIIEEVIEYYISQQIPLIVLDNYSTDSTFNICKKYLGKGILELERFKSKTFQKETVLRILYDMAIANSADWIIAIDSDEFLESGVQNLTLKDAIVKSDNNGYNLIQFDIFLFFMTDDDESLKSIKDRLRYYSYESDYSYRAWKYSPGIRCEDSVGHLPYFPEGLKYKIDPKKCLMRHYKLRSKEQAIKKVKDRIRGLSLDGNGRPINNHYKNLMTKDYAKKIDHRLLTKYEEDGKWNYEKKYALIPNVIPKTREQIFSDDGSLINRDLSKYELKLLYYEKLNQRLSKKLRRIFSFAKNKIISQKKK